MRDDADHYANRVEEEKFEEKKMPKLPAYTKNNFMDLGDRRATMYAGLWWKFLVGCWQNKYPTHRQFLRRGRLGSEIDVSLIKFVYYN